MMHDKNCIFCKMLDGQIPAVKVYEDEQTLAFMDIFPVTEGHVLVIGKAHHADLFSISPDQLSAVTLTCQKVARAIHTALEPAGLRVAQFNGEAAGQTVFHYHVHLRPAYENQDSRRSHGLEQASAETLEPIAARIRSALGAS